MQLFTRRKTLIGLAIASPIFGAVGTAQAQQAQTSREKRNLKAIQSYFDGLNSKDVSHVPFAPNVTFSTPLLKNPAKGEAAVRQLTADFARRLLRVRIDRHVIDGDFAYSRFEIDWPENVVAHSTDYFTFADGKIASVEVYFDPRELLALFERQKAREGGTALVRSQPVKPQTTFDTYKNKYSSFRLERTSSGILTVKMHTNGGPLRLSLMARQEFPQVFHDIATDLGNEVVILTGSGSTWIKDVEFESFGNVADPQVFKGTLTDLRRTLYNLLDIEVPVIAAVDGPAFINSHFALVNDVVLASETAQFQDLPHIPSGLVPADGVQVVYEELLGPVRARHFLWTGRIMSAQEALRLGVVAEVLPSDRLMSRANELAEQLLKTPSLTRRYTRLVLTKRLKQRIVENVPYDMALEGASITASGNPESE